MSDDRIRLRVHEWRCRKCGGLVRENVPSDAGWIETHCTPTKWSDREGGPVVAYTVLCPDPTCHAEHSFAREYVGELEDADRIAMLEAAAPARMPDGLAVLLAEVDEIEWELIAGGRGGVTIKAPDHVTLVSLLVRLSVWQKAGE